MTKDMWDDIADEGIVGMAQNIIGKYKRKKTQQQIDDAKQQIELLKAQADLEKVKKDTKKG